MVIQTGNVPMPGSRRRGYPFARGYRVRFIAQLASNAGTRMQSIAAQRFLVEEHSSDVIVALVQAVSIAGGCANVRHVASRLR